MNTPSAKTGNSPAPAARTQSAPATSNAVATEVDVAIDGKAYPINKNETMLAFMRRFSCFSGEKGTPTQPSLIPR